MATCDRPWPGAVLFLAACLPKPDASGDQVEIVVDMEAVEMDAPNAEAAVGLFTAEQGEGGVSVSDRLLASAVAAESVLLGPLLVADGDILTLPSGDGSFDAAVYVPALWSDTNGDLQRDQGEPFLGTGFEWIVYATSVTGALDDLGFEDGWNLARVDIGTEGTLTVLGPDEGPIELGPTLALRDRIHLEGVANGIDSHASRLVVAPATHVAFGKGSATDTLMNEALTSTWAIDLSTIPPLDHIFGGIASELLFSYVDNGDGVFDANDREVGIVGWKPVCDPYGTSVVAWYSPQPDTLEGALGDEALGIRAGWSPVRIVSSGGKTTVYEALPDAQWLDLSVGAVDCGLD